MAKKAALVFVVSCLLGLPAMAQTKQVITVLDFKTDGVSEKEMRSIIELLSSALFNTGKYQVIDVTQRETLLKEVEFSASGCSDEGCQLKIGKMLSAELIGVGNIGKVGSRFLVSAKMLETETARIHSATDGIYTNLDALVDALPLLAKKLAGVVEAAPAAQAAQATKPEQPGKPDPAAKPAAVPQSKPARGTSIAGIASAAVGAAAAGVGGWFLYDGIVNGKASVDAAQAAYDATTEANADSLYAALLEAADGMKTKLYLGIGCAAGGVALGILGTVLLLLPEAVPADGAKVSMGILPEGDSVRLSLRVRY